MAVQIIYALGALASAVAAVAAWVAKIRWANEYEKAKAAQIETLNTQVAQMAQAKEDQAAMFRGQIEGLERLTPTAIHEYFDSVKEQLEGYVEHLKGKAKELEQQIENLTKQGMQKDERLTEAHASLEKLRGQLQDAESASAASGLAKAVVGVDFVSPAARLLDYEHLSPQTLNRIELYSRVLSRAVDARLEQQRREREDGAENEGDDDT